MKHQLADVLAEYVENLEHYALAHRERRFVDGNKYVDRMRKAANLLRHGFGAEGRCAIVALLSHPDVDFRINAASIAIDFATMQASSVLQEIERANTPFKSTEAHYCLKEWQAGNKQMPGGLVTLEPGENYN